MRALCLFLSILCLSPGMAFSAERAKVVVSMTRPLTTGCVLNAARARGSMGEALSNTNGTWDLGCFQINTVHVNELAAMGIAPETLLRDGCVNAYAAAWLLRKEYERTGDLWLAIGAYHSRTPHRRDAYIRKVRTNLEELRRRGISSLSSLQEAQP